MADQPPLDPALMNQSATSQPPHPGQDDPGGPQSQAIPPEPPPSTFNNAQPPRPVATLQVQLQGDRPVSFHAGLPLNTNQNVTGPRPRRLPIVWSRPRFRRPDYTPFSPPERSHPVPSTPGSRLIAAGITPPSSIMETGTGTAGRQPAEPQPESPWLVQIWGEDLMQIWLENLEATEQEMHQLIQESLNTAPLELFQHPREACRDEYNQLMWLRFRFEYLRAQIGLMEGFSSAVLYWLERVMNRST